MNGINDRAHDMGWRDKIESGHAPEDKLPLYNWDRTDRVLNITTLTTGALPEGILAHFKDSDGGSTLVFLPRSIARSVVIGIAGIGDLAKWWNDDFELLPAEMPDDVTVQRAADQMIKRFGDSAASEAAMRSNAAMDVGDMFNHLLWQRVLLAVQELERTAPKLRNAIN
jgi:hypothetical protein